MRQKTQVTQKFIKQSFDYILYGDYTIFCEISNKLPYPNWYTSGVYGWKSDIWIIDNKTCLVLGYGPFGTEKVRNSEKLLETLKNLDFPIYEF